MRTRDRFGNATAHAVDYVTASLGRACADAHCHARTRSCVGGCFELVYRPVLAGSYTLVVGVSELGRVGEYPVRVSPAAPCATLTHASGGGVARFNAPPTGVSEKRFTVELYDKYGNACESSEGARLSAATMWLGCLDDAPQVRIEDKLNGTFSCSYEAR